MCLSDTLTLGAGFWVGMVWSSWHASPNLETLSYKLAGGRVIRGPLFSVCHAWGRGSILKVGTKWKKVAPHFLASLAWNLASTTRGWGRWEILVAYSSQEDTVALGWVLRGCTHLEWSFHHAELEGKGRIPIPHGGQMLQALAVLTEF